MKIVGPWSNSSSSKLRLDQCPKIGEDGLVTNITAPYWHDIVEHAHVEIEHAEAADSVGAKLEAPPNKQRKCQGEGSKRRIRKARQQIALNVGGLYKSRRVRHLYVMPYASQSRGETC